MSRHIEEVKNLVLEAGRRLVSEGLVARTWGNVSARVDADSFVITPSGIAYERLTPDDLVLYFCNTGESLGARQPSSEKGIHSEAYRIFPDVNFVVHTHQDFASAFSVAGLDGLRMGDDEGAAVGKVAIADYALSGTKGLRRAVAREFEGGARTVLMAHHGVVFAGRDAEEAFEAAAALEDACKRCVDETLDANLDAIPEAAEDYDDLARKIAPDLPYVRTLTSKYAIAWSIAGEDLRAQIDDMAQMIGRRVRCIGADVPRIQSELNRCGAVFVKYLGAIVASKSEDDARALELLLNKAAICALYTKLRGIDGRLGAADVSLQHLKYSMKYSKLTQER